MVSGGILKSGTIIRESTTGEKNLIGASKGKNKSVRSLLREYENKSCPRIKATFIEKKIKKPLLLFEKIRYVFFFQQSSRLKT